MRSGNRQKKANGATRPIRTERDYMGAASVVKKIGAKTGLEPAEEQRMRTLIQEMERFDDQDDDAPQDPYADEYAGARRRWSDESADPD
jgi:hypothetical protein